jgi:hypothetical protein
MEGHTLSIPAPFRSMPNMTPSSFPKGRARDPYSSSDGRLDHGATPEAAATREVREECGLRRDASRLSVLAHVLAHDELGNLSFGPLFRSVDLAPGDMREARRCSDRGCRRRPARGKSPPAGTGSRPSVAPKPQSGAGLKPNPAFENSPRRGRIKPCLSWG